jgi:putative Mn2+ efflux pump MntP
LPVPALVIAVAEQAFVVTQLGLRLGDRLGETARDAAEQLAGVALLTLGAILLVRQLGA